MAWTTPKTFTAGSVLTAAELNTHLRDNLNETCAPTVTTAGDMTYADAANSMGGRLALGAAGEFMVSDGSAPTWKGFASSQQNASAFTFTNGSFLALDAVTGGTAGSAVSVTATTGTKVLLMWRARFANSSAGAVGFLSYSISGATTQAASAAQALAFESSAANDQIYAGTQDLVAVTAGSNTFELEARTTAGTQTMQYTELIVLG